MKKSALIIVDVQNDFCPGGSLAVPDGDRIIPVINKLIPKFALVVTTKDWHPANHCSFKENGGIWPAHCVRGTIGSRLHGELDIDQVDEDDLINIFKGVETGVDSYSAFFDNERINQTALDELLKENNVDTVYVTGLATDYCVKFTVLDALSLSYNTYLVSDAIAGVEVNSGDCEQAIEEMVKAGAKVITSTEVEENTSRTYTDSYLLNGK